MPELTPDRRRLDWEADPEAIEALGQGQASWLDRELSLARTVATVDRKRAFVGEGASSTENLAAELRYDAQRVRELVQLGRGIHEEPELEARVREGRISFRAAIVVGRILGWPERVQAGDDWLTVAETVRLNVLRHRVRRRIEELAQKRRLRALTVHVTPETVEKIDHCRMLAGKHRGSLQTIGQTIEFMADETIRHRDPRWKPPRRRRMAPTPKPGKQRGVPADATREIWRRSGGVCEFGSCTRPGRDRCHLESFAEGAGSEVDDQVLGCRTHHIQLDDGLLRFLGWTEDGRPRFEAVATGRVLEPKPRADEGVDEEDPPPGYPGGALGRHAAPSRARASEDARPRRAADSGPRERGPP